MKCCCFTFRYMLFQCPPLTSKPLRRPNTKRKGHKGYKPQTKNSKWRKALSQILTSWYSTKFNKNISFKINCFLSSYVCFQESGTLKMEKEGG